MVTMAVNRIAIGNVNSAVLVILFTLVCICDGSWYSEPHRIHGDPVNPNDISSSSRPVMKNEMRQWADNDFDDDIFNDDYDTSEWEGDDDEYKDDYDDDDDTDSDRGDAAALKQLQKKEKKAASLIKKLAPAPRTGISSPETCPCTMKKASPFSKCYYYTAEGSKRCSFRKCKESFECNFGGHVKLTCMRRNTKKQVVPNGPGICRTQTINGYMYVPYTSSY